MHWQPSSRSYSLPKDYLPWTRSTWKQCVMSKNSYSKSRIWSTWLIESSVTLYLSIGIWDPTSCLFIYQCPWQSRSTCRCLLCCLKYCNPQLKTTLRWLCSPLKLRNQLKINKNYKQKLKNRNWWRRVKTSINFLKSLKSIDFECTPTSCTSVYISNIFQENLQNWGGIGSMKGMPLTMARSFTKVQLKFSNTFTKWTYIRC